MLLETVANIVNGRKIRLLDQIINIGVSKSIMYSSQFLCIQELKNLEDNVNLNFRSKLPGILIYRQRRTSNLKSLYLSTDLVAILLL